MSTASETYPAASFGAGESNAEMFRRALEHRERGNAAFRRQKFQEVRAFSRSRNARKPWKNCRLTMCRR